MAVEFQFEFAAVLGMCLLPKDSGTSLFLIFIDLYRLTPSRGCPSSGIVLARFGRGKIGVLWYHSSDDHCSVAGTGAQLCAQSHLLTGAQLLNVAHEVRFSTTKNAHELALMLTGMFIKQCLACIQHEAFHPDPPCAQPRCRWRPGLLSQLLESETQIDALIKPQRKGCIAQFL